MPKNMRQTEQSLTVNSSSCKENYFHQQKFLQDIKTSHLRQTEFRYPHEILALTKENQIRDNPILSVIFFMNS